MKDMISKAIEEKRELYSSVNEEIWANPEFSFQEYKSSKILMDVLEEHGFQVETGLADIPTAFKAVYGTGKPVIGFLAEYDALAGMSQKKGIAEKEPIEEGGNGHGCGHCAIGTSCVAAAIAMKETMEKKNVSGTVIVFGCPAEENGSGKSFMARDGIFDGVDIAMAPHPGDSDMVVGCALLANVQVEYSFKGVSSHAAVVPQHGRSALDAADLMIVGVQFLREHIIQDARIHHAYLDVGGISPNVVQASSKLLFYIRAPKAEQVLEIFERVNDVARGAALMTGTQLEINHISGIADLIPNDVIGNALSESWHELGECEFSEEARAIAEKMAPTVGKTTEDRLINSSIPGYASSNVVLPGSSDVGDVSYVAPTGSFLFTGYCAGTPGHSWQLVSQAGTAIMNDGLIHAAKVMALTGMKFIENQDLVEAAKKEFLARTNGKKVSLVPVGAKPPV